VATALRAISAFCRLYLGSFRKMMSPPVRSIGAAATLVVG
jgi:hypothetical protein